MTYTEINVPLLLASLAFLAICLLCMGIIVYVKQSGDRRSFKAKLRARQTRWNEAQSVAGVLPSVANGGGFIKTISAVGLKTNPGRTTDDADIKMRFLRAGFKDKNVPTLFWGTKFLLAVMLPLVCLVIIFFFFRDFKNIGLLWTAISASLAGLYLPDVWLALKTKKRRELIIRGFPDALDLLVVCVEAGMGLDGAIKRVGDEVSLGHPELSEELLTVNRELRAGKARQAALKNLAERTNSEDVGNLVTVLIQTDRFGTSVAKALRVFSDSFRTTRYQRAEEVAAKIATKLIFPLVLFIFPSMFAVILGPIGITIYRTMINPS